MPGDRGVPPGLESRSQTEAIISGELVQDRRLRFPAIKSLSKPGGLNVG